MADIVISEYKDQKRTYAAIQFTCIAPPECGTKAEGLMNPQDPPTATGDTTESVVEEFYEAEIPDPTTFPLAKHFDDPSSFVGKKIRLGFFRGTSNPKKQYPWVWPAVIDFLAGRVYFHNNPQKHESWKLPLDEWASKHKNSILAARLVENKQASGVIQWALQPKR